jgi:hypothetical protein
MKHSNKLYLALLAITIFAIGCNTGTTPNEPGGQMRIPGEGSYYIFKNALVDRNGLDSSVTFDTVKVVATGLNYQGKTNVVNMFQGRSSIFLSYPPNGDLEGYVDGDVGGRFALKSMWITIPTGSRTATFYTLLDSTTQDSLHITGKETDSYTFVGTDTIMFQGQTLQTVKIREEYYRFRSDQSGASGTYPSTFWIAPELGYFVKIEEDARPSHSEPASRTRLIEYLLK